MAQMSERDERQRQRAGESTRQHDATANAMNRAPATDEQARTAP